MALNAQARAHSQRRQGLSKDNRAVERRKRRVRALLKKGKVQGDKRRQQMRPTFGTLGRMTGILLGGTLSVVASAQQAPQKPKQLQYDSTPAYQEKNVTPPAAANASDALKTRPGKTSSGKGAAPDRPNGIGFDAGASGMGKKQ
jgi:hypothetical protein